MQPAKPTGATIETLTTADIPAAMSLKNELGWNQTPEDWERFLRIAPGGVFKLVAGGRLAGTAAAFVFERVCSIGMIVVREAYRRQGHGRRLVQRCLEHAAARRCTMTQLYATREGMSLYASLGFQAGQLVGTSRGRIVPPEGPQEPSGLPDGLSLAPAGPPDLGELVLLEEEALGAKREPLLRELVGREPFGEARGVVCRSQSGKLQGFLLYRPGQHSLQIGPLIARSQTAAERLLRAGFQQTRGRFPDVSLTLPLANQAMLERLRRWGLPVTPRLTYMFRGRKRLRAREDMVYAFSGPEKG